MDIVYHDERDRTKRIAEFRAVRISWDMVGSVDMLRILRASASRKVVVLRFGFLTTYPTGKGSKIVKKGLQQLAAVIATTTKSHREIATIGETS
jgi:hypothetical protein